MTAAAQRRPTGPSGDAGAQELPLRGDRDPGGSVPVLLETGQRLLAPVLLLVAWQVVSASGAASPQILPSPVDVVRAGMTLWAEGQLQDGLLISLWRATAGLAIGVTAGTVLGLVAGLSRTGENIVDTPVQMFRAVPILALVPLFILWFGIGERSKILMVALATLFPIYINLHSAIRNIDRRYFELAQTSFLSRQEIIRDVLLPGSLAGWLVGLRYSSGLAWLVLVVSEQVNAMSGLGYLMMDARQSFRTDIVILGIVLYGLLGIATDRIVRRLETHLLRWQRAGDGTR